MISPDLHLVAVAYGRRGPQKVRLVGHPDAAAAEARQLRTAGWDGPIVLAEREAHDPRAVPPPWWPDEDDAA